MLFQYLLTTSSECECRCDRCHCRMFVSFCLFVCLLVGWLGLGLCALLCACFRFLLLAFCYLWAQVGLFFGWLFLVDATDWDDDFSCRIAGAILPLGIHFFFVVCAFHGAVAWERFRSFLRRHRLAYRELRTTTGTTSAGTHRIFQTWMNHDSSNHAQVGYVPQVGSEGLSPEYRMDWIQIRGIVCNRVNMMKCKSQSIFLFAGVCSHIIPTNPEKVLRVTVVKKPFFFCLASRVRAFYYRWCDATVLRTYFAQGNVRTAGSLRKYDEKWSTWSYFMLLSIRFFCFTLYLVGVQWMSSCMWWWDFLVHDMNSYWASFVLTHLPEHV